MADIELKSFPFDSMQVLNEDSGEMEEDRLYESQVFRDYFRKFLSNGVYFGHYKDYGENSMKVILDTGLSIKVTKGCGIIEGADYENDTDKIITLERPETGNRIDRIVVQMNISLDTRATKLIVKPGDGETPAELIRTENIYEICLAEVTVKSTSNLAENDIVDKRLDKELCGVVGSLISIDGEEIYQNFKDYIENIKENLMMNNKDNICTGKITAQGGFVGDLEGLDDKFKSLNDKITKINQGAKIASCAGLSVTPEDTEYPIGSFTKIPIAKLAFNNSQFKIYDQGIYCPFDGNIMVSASIHLSKRYGYNGIAIYKNGLYVHGYFETEGVQKFGGVSLSNISVKVNKDDIIYLYVQLAADSDANKSAIDFGDKRTRLTIMYTDIS